MNDYLSVMKSTKFKDVTIVVRFLTELNTQNVIKRSILSEMLQDRSEKYNTKEKVSDLLDNMYGALIGAKCSSFGKYHMFEFRVKSLNNRFVENDLLTEQFEVFNQFLYHPELSEESFNEAKANYIFSIQRQIDKPASYASGKAYKIIGEGYPLADSILPSIDEIDQLTLKDIRETYTSMINNDNTYCYILGDVTEKKSNVLASEYLRSHKSNELKEIEYLIHKKDYQEVNEFKQIEQSALVMIFETNTYFSDDDYWTLRVANAMFGQLPTSLLFQEVREKRSLCYSVHSSIQSLEGLLAIHTGVQRENIDEAKDVILQQFNIMKNGEFSDDLLNTAKEMLINIMNQSDDNMNSAMNLDFQHKLTNTSRKLETIINQIKSTTHNDIVTVFSKIEHKLTYRLLQEEK